MEDTGLSGGHREASGLPADKQHEAGVGTLRRRQVGIRQLLMLQLGVALLLVMGQLALHCWTAAEWWKMFAFNAALLMATVLSQLYASVCGGPKDAVQ